MSIRMMKSQSDVESDKLIEDDKKMGINDFIK